MIVGIGVDVVDLKRFERAASRTPALLERLFTDAERGLPLRSLAGRFAAKEALIKAIGDSTGVRWHDMEIVSNELGNPSFVLHNAVSSIVAARNPRPAKPGSPNSVIWRTGEDPAPRANRRGAS